MIGIEQPPSDDPIKEAKARIERAFRVKFDQEPKGEVLELIIEQSAQRVAKGESFRWENRGGMFLIRYGTPEEEGPKEQAMATADTLYATQKAQENDLEALEAEETSQIVSMSEQSIREAIRTCSAKEAQYCRLRAAGMTGGTAYVSAGWKASSKNSAYACASMLEKRPHVAAYLRSLKEVAWKANVLSLAEKRAGLADAWRTPVGEVDENHPLAQEVTIKEYVDKEGNVTGTEKKVKMVPKLAALELDAKLAGELREQQATTNSFSFTLLSSSLGMDETEEAQAIEVNPEVLPE